ncbi:MAG: hypothetical protein K2G31_03340, partial [Clostridia bacterium]|nr:hypothetical protein [Clostridia bacterium]
VKVRVTAKYPKYESVLKYVTGEVDIKVVYGVQVSTMAELRQASADQEAYAYLEGNYKAPEQIFENINPETGVTYRMYTSASSVRNYAICFAKDTDITANDASTSIAYEYDVKGNPVFMDNGDTVKVHGDVYGNNGMLSAEKQQLNKDAALLRILWSNVTVSNLRLRANILDSSGSVDADDTNGFSGKCFDIYNGDNHHGYHLENIRIEYCIVENARQAIGSFSADLTLDGLIVRNVSTVSMYVPMRVGDYWDHAQQCWVTGMSYNHLNMNNCIFSNCLQSVGSFSYERVTLTNSKELRFAVKQADEDDKEVALRNTEYFLENFAAKGINTIVRQTGFIDIYNWHDIKKASLIQIDGDGMEAVNVVISRASEKIVTTNSLFANVRYWSESEQTFYFHMGFISTGISMGQGIMDEQTFLDLSCEDKNINEEGIETLKIEAESSDGETKTYERLIKGFSIKFYNYKNTSTVTPYSTYTLDYNLIRHLHGEQ